MTEVEKKRVIKMRTDGEKYSVIAVTFGLSENTVKSYCRRNGLATSKKTPSSVNSNEKPDVCANCGKPLKQSGPGKPKRFCSELCRREWWKKHTDQSDRKAMYIIVCKHCGKPFESYGNNRKYCSRACYISERYGGDVCDQ